MVSLAGKGLVPHLANGSLTFDGVVIVLSYNYVVVLFCDPHYVSACVDCL